MTERAEPSSIEIPSRSPAAVLSAASLLWNGARRELLTSVACQSITAALIVVQLLLVKRTLRAVTDVVSATSVAVIGLVAALAFVAAGALIATAVAGEVRTVMSRRSSSLAIQRLISSVANLDLIEVEQTRYNDVLNRAQRGVTIGSLQLSQGLHLLMTSAAAVIGSAVALALISPATLVILALSCVPIGYAALSNAALARSLVLLRTPAERRRSYLVDLAVSVDSAAQLRASSAFGYVAAKVDAIDTELIADSRRLARRRSVRMIVSGILLAISTASALGYVLYLIRAQTLSVAEGVTAIGAAVIASRGISITGIGMQQWRESSYFLRDYTQILSMSARQRHCPAPERFHRLQRFRVEHLTFTYPDAEAPALRDITLTGSRGQFIAIVGRNGAGKTTLGKLLAGLYDPAGGTITWNTTPTNGQAMRLRESCAIALQVNAHLKLTVRENLELADPRHRVTDAEAYAALEAVGLRPVVAGFPDGEKTILGTSFGGTELSSGQWQRLSLAQTMTRRRDLVVFDEPTTHLDADSRALLLRYLDGCADRLVIAITHDYQLLTRADHIYFLQHGTIVDHGDLKSLEARNYEFRQLFSTGLDRTGLP